MCNRAQTIRRLIDDKQLTILMMKNLFTCHRLLILNIFSLGCCQKEWLEHLQCWETVVDTDIIKRMDSFSPTLHVEPWEDLQIWTHTLDAPKAPRTTPVQWKGLSDIWFLFYTHKPTRTHQHDVINSSLSDTLLMAGRKGKTQAEKHTHPSPPELSAVTL